MRCEAEEILAGSFLGALICQVLSLCEVDATPLREKALA